VHYLVERAGEKVAEKEDVQTIQRHARRMMVMPMVLVMLAMLMLTAIGKSCWTRKTITIGRCGR
jgi:hypothetical protein